jgi:glycosyltransferase involved in cell wall biosynthesis
MAFGLPVVASRVEGIPEIISHGTDGLLVPAEDITELGGSIAMLLRDPQLRQRLGNRARETVRLKFGLERMVTAEYEFYSSLLERSYSKRSSDEDYNRG